MSVEKNNNNASPVTHKQALTLEEMEQVNGGSFLAIAAVVIGGIAAAAAVVGLAGFAAYAGRRYHYWHC